MSNALPLVSVLVPSRPGPTELPSVVAARKLNYPPERLEIIIAWGHPVPAKKRNQAVRAATGELVYFLDDDSLPDPDNLRRGVPHFKSSEIQVVGGPNLCPENAPFREQVFAAVMGNVLAFGPSCARYRAVGQLRDTSEKELILCNMIVRRQAFLDAGGFDEALYPNEENALLEKFKTQGGRLLYDPSLTVHRRPRRTLRAFLIMLMTYGRGRAEQFRLHPGPGSAANFIPPLFCLYVLLFAFVPTRLWWPMPFYAGLLVLSGCWSAFKHPAMPAVRRVVMATLIPPLIGLTHLMYGIGFWRGLFTRVKKESTGAEGEIRLETVKV